MAVRRRSPFELRVGTERLVHFPGAVQVGAARPAARPCAHSEHRRHALPTGPSTLRAHPCGGAQCLDEGPVYLLDLCPPTVDSARATGPIEIFNAGRGAIGRTVSAAPSENARARWQYGYVTLTRFAAQQLYAPARLLNALPGVVRVPVKREPVVLVRGAAIDAVPLIAWRAGDRFVTAVTLTNITRHPQILDPRTLRGRWLTATFQHNRVHAAGSEADRTVVYLLSARPFAASL